MNKTELLELIHNGENSGVEFKRDTEDNRALAKELVALANLKGGRVVLGVNKDRTISGLTRVDPNFVVDDKPRTYDRLEEWVMQACRDKVRPEIIPYFEIVRDIEPGKDVAVIEVERGWSVHHVWHDNHRTYYIRVGTLSREASPEELERLFQERGQLRVEVRGVSGSSIADLDTRRLIDYFTNVRGQPVPEAEPAGEMLDRLKDDSKREDPEHWESIYEERLRAWRDEQQALWRSLLVNTEILDSTERNPATVAGLLLFGKSPKRYMPQAGIDAAAYEGVEKDYAARERVSLRSAMVALLSADRRVVEAGLVEDAIAFVRRNTRTQSALVDGARREDASDYPEEAVREAIVNALVHRDYALSATDIELSVYGDRLEIVSPGRLPNGITPERMRIGCRAARNQLLKDTMRDYGYVEHMGLGVPRKIVRLMQKHNGIDPELIEDGERFIVRLWKEAKTA